MQIKNTFEENTKIKEKQIQEMLEIWEEKW